MSTSMHETDDLQSVVSEPHAHAREALDDPVPGRSAAVAWSSAHLAAVDRVLYPAVLHALPERRPDVRAARAVDHRLQQALCRLDRQLMGDVQLDHIPVAALVGQVQDALQLHTDTEARLVAELEAVLPQEDQQQLAHQLAAAMDAAPTRPHPHTRHSPLSPLIAWCDAVVDRVRDALDNRVDPLGRPPRAVSAPSRWGSYWMGIPYPEEPTRRAG